MRSRPGRASLSRVRPRPSSRGELVGIPRWRTECQAGATGTDLRLNRGGDALRSRQCRTITRERLRPHILGIVSGFLMAAPVTLPSLRPFRLWQVDRSWITLLMLSNQPRAVHRSGSGIGIRGGAVSHIRRIHFGVNVQG